MKLVALLVITLAVCVAAKQKHQVQVVLDEEQVPAQAPAAQPNAAYTYNNHGADWEGTCKTGRQQSPIDVIQNSPTCIFSNAHVLEGESLLLSYRYNALANLTLERTSYGLRVKVPQSAALGYAMQGYCSCDNPSKWLITSFRFKSPSDHTIDGHNFPLELQIVHQKQGSTNTSDRLIVSVMFDVSHIPGGGNTNYFLETLDWRMNLFKLQVGQSQVISNRVDLNSLVYSLDGDYFAYVGSENHPPCQEGVQWRILKRFQSMSGKQAAAVKAAFGAGNNRNTQPLNDRKVIFFQR